MAPASQFQVQSSAATRLRPSFLARYSARSALTSNEGRSDRSAAASARPTLTVAENGLIAGMLNPERRRPSGSAPQRTTHPLGSCPEAGKRTPLHRCAQTDRSAATARAARLQKSNNTASPAAWPKASLIALKRSRSKSSNAIGQRSMLARCTSGRLGGGRRADWRHQSTGRRMPPSCRPPKAAP